MLISRENPQILSVQSLEAHQRVRVPFAVFVEGQCLRWEAAAAVEVRTMWWHG